MNDKDINKTSHIIRNKLNEFLSLFMISNNQAIEDGYSYMCDEYKFTHFLEENREMNSWIEKKEYIVYNFNGPDYKKTQFKEADIYLQFTFKRREDERLSTKQIKMISVFGGAFIVVAGMVYYLIAKNFNLSTAFSCIAT